MKTRIMVILVGTLIAATTAEAQWWRFGREKAEEQERPAPAAPRTMRGPQGEPVRGRPYLTEEQIEQRRKDREAIVELGEAYRAETDPAKKEEIKQKLREKLCEISDRMEQAHQRRLENVSEEVKRMEERAKESRKHREKRIDEQLERILSGEPLAPVGERPAGERPVGPERRPAPRR